MKSKKLIELLQELDPSGEIEVCTGHGDIYFIHKLPAYYYDGHLQVLELDETRSDEYNIIGVKDITQGDKICLVTQSIRNFILDNSEGKITFDHEPTHWELERIEKWRQESRTIDKLWENHNCKKEDL